MADRLDTDALRAWLVGPEVVDDDGGVWSWRGVPAGSRYPEAGGLWLSWIASVAPDEPRAPRVAAWLERAIAEGRVGRDGVRYAFDLGVVLTGLVRWRRASTTPPSDAMRSGAAALVAMITERRAVVPDAVPGRWSTRFGAHQRKLAVALDRLDELDLADTSRAREMLWQATEAERLDVTAEGGEPIYVHAAAYALEGSWVLGATDTVARGASWLAEIQRSDGGVTAWWDRRRGAHGPARADATAQAIRLWCAADPRRHARAIAGGLAFLAGLQDPDGALRYDGACAHRNVWCTLFAWQALAFARRGARPEALL